MRCVILFPGQGAQTPHFLRALPDHAAVLETFSEAAQVLEEDPRNLDSADALKSTVAVQLSALIAGVAYARLLSAKAVEPDGVAGLSVGAFAAAVACGSLSFPDALRLVRLRAASMESAFARSGAGMLALLGLGEAAVRTLVDGISLPSAPLYLASVNSPTEIVLAGADAALTAAAEAASRAGARARRLSVGVPSHCPLLDSVSERLREAFSEVQLRSARVPYIGNVRARALTNAADIAEDLILNVSRTVRWHESVTLAYELGARVFVEAPPGRALSNLVKNEFPQARALAGADSPLDSVVHAAATASPSAP